MLKLEKRKKEYSENINDEYEKYYLLHHMHHFESARGATHALHHCFLFSEENMRGDKFQIFHKVFNKQVFHCVFVYSKKELYDHANNVYHIKMKKINNKKIYEIKFGKRKNKK